MSDKIVLLIGKTYIVLVMAIAISSGILDRPAVGFAVWFFGLVIPLLWLLVLRRRLA